MQGYCRGINAARYTLWIVLITTSSIGAQFADVNQGTSFGDQSVNAASAVRRISAIEVLGNKFTPTAAITAYIPYRVGEIFDPSKTQRLIKNIYNDLGRFSKIDIKGHNRGDDRIDLYIIVEEKPPLKDIIFVGNTKLTETELRKKIDFDIPAIDQSDVGVLARRIAKLYAEKGYDAITIDTNITIDLDERAVVTFTIREGRPTAIRRIEFTGNDSVSSKELRTVLFTKEDWLLSFIDGSGTYIADRLEADRFMIEQFYQNRGHLHARVLDVHTTHIEGCAHEIILTFDIEEGACYTISDVQVTGSDLIPVSCVLDFIPVKVGQRFSREHVVESLKAIEALWGNSGYIFAHVTPSIQQDEATKTVTIAFHVQPGEEVFVRKINIKGNRKTRDKVIRRQIVVQEGSRVSQALLDISQQSVESLGYFEPRDGVNWKVQRVGSNKADLDLMVREAKTGNFNIQLGYGGQQERKSPLSGLSFKGLLADRNLFGLGIDFNIEASWAQAEQTVAFHIGQHWLFDKPVSGAIDFYHRRPSYEDFRHIEQGGVYEKVTGGAATIGIITPPLWPIFSDTQVLMSVGVDSIHYEQRPKANIASDPLINGQYQTILDREFVAGTFPWISNRIERVVVNHPIHPSRGYRWHLQTKFAIPTKACNSIGFYKMSFDGDWYTPLIDEYGLVFHIHTTLGAMTPFKNQLIPFNELWHVGGQNSVRGWLFGQIGPRFLDDSIGAQCAFWWNAELLFPITANMNMTGVVFYDGGAGWANPNARFLDPVVLRGNSFDYRHSVGVGIRLRQPMPISVDWGFKIDPRRNRLNPARDETAYEIHFGAHYSW